MPVKKTASRKAIATDLVVGANVRQLRMDAGWTLSELADALGISHQQLQKYETGSNRVSAGMLYELARTFAVPIDALFEGSDPAKEKDEAVVRARRKCLALVDRTSSAEMLEAMERVLRALSRD